jgi:polyhydroxyalkanoate synthase subunit PhaC
MNRWSLRAQNLGALAVRPKVPVGVTPADVVHAENKWRLLRYRPRHLRFKTPVLLVPSLINRHYVLDLMPGKSLAEWLVERGHDVFVIDWGTPGDEDRYLTFDDICDRYIGRALRKAAAYGPSGKAHVLGYCLGGTLAVIHAAVRPEHVASLLCIAAPVKFGGSAGGQDSLLEAWTRLSTFDVNSLVDAFGNVPWQLMQSAFHMLRPTMGLSKAVHLVDRAWSDEFLDGFLAIETWSNDNVSFPGECYRTYIESIYRKDELAMGTFALSGIPARLENIHCPVFAISFEHDSIVPADSAKALTDRVGSKDKTHLHLPGGHVGAVVSKAAADRLWPKLSDFWSQRDDLRNALPPPPAVAH